MCGATVFVLFQLHLASQIASPSKFFGHFIYISAAPRYKHKQTLELLILHLAIFYYLSIIIADQTCYSIGRQGELLVKLIFSQQSNFQLAVHLFQSRHQVIQMMCAMFTTCKLTVQLLLHSLGFGWDQLTHMLNYSQLATLWFRIIGGRLEQQEGVGNFSMY